MFTPWPGRFVMFMYTMHARVFLSNMPLACSTGKGNDTNARVAAAVVLAAAAAAALMLVRTGNPHDQREPANDRSSDMHGRYDMTHQWQPQQQQPVRRQ